MSQHYCGVRSSLCIILYLIELAQRGDEISPLTRRLKVSQRFLDDRRVATVAVVILQFQLLGIHDTLV